METAEELPENKLGIAFFESLDSIKISTKKFKKKKEILAENNFLMFYHRETSHQDRNLRNVPAP